MANIGVMRAWLRKVLRLSSYSLKWKKKKHVHVFIHSKGPDFPGDPKLVLRLLDPEDIVYLYDRHCHKSDEYYRKYEKVPLHLMDARWPWENHDYPRIPCLLDFIEWTTKYGIRSPDSLLCTSIVDPEPFYLSPKNVRYEEYEVAGNRNDLHTLDLDKKDFDFVIFSQTLEHLYNPLLALYNLKCHMKIGGYIFTSVPMINVPHMVPVHFWGMNMMGLASMFTSLGFEVLEVGEWGNKKYIDYIFSRHNWPDYRELIEDGVIRNERQNACQAWILARKTSA